MLADKAYDADWIRDLIWEQGAIDVIPPKANRKLPAEFDAEIYRERNKIERFFGGLKASFRRIATRYEKTSRNFLSMIKLASVSVVDRVANGAESRDCFVANLTYACEQATLCLLWKRSFLDGRARLGNRIRASGAPNVP